ncbi:MAG: DUF4190 domain-containing protein [Actinomycetota bacterium]
MEREASDLEERYAPLHHQHRISHGLATAALVLGILGIVFSAIPFLFFVGIILDIIAIVLGAVARSQIKSDATAYINAGSATAGIVTGMVGLLVAMIWIGLFISSTNQLIEFRIESLSGVTGIRQGVIG